MNFNELKNILANGTANELAKFCTENDLIIKEGKIFHQDPNFAKAQIDHYDKRQLVTKIQLNS